MLMTDRNEVREAARDYLPWAALTPLAGVLAFQMDGVFIGATWSRDMRNMMLLSLGVYLAAWWLLRRPLGNHGLWLALHVFLLARGSAAGGMLRPRMRDEPSPDRPVSGRPIAALLDPDRIGDRGRPRRSSMRDKVRDGCARRAPARR